MTIDLKSIVAQQIPEFAREDHPLFVEFIEAYYEYVDRYEKRNLTDLRDIDNTLDSFIQYFKSELDIFGSTYSNIDQRLFLRKIKEVFVAKGTEASYKFLFKLLYGKTAEITYPWDQVLKASDGKWQQDMSLFVRISTGNPQALVGNRITIHGVNQNLKVFVLKVRLVENDVYEVFIDRYYYGDIKVGYTLSDGDVTGTILPTTVKYTVVFPGVGYKIGQIINGTTVSTGKTINQKLKVTRVNKDGGIISLATLGFGYGYDSAFYLIQSSGTINSSSTMQVDKNSLTQYKIPNDTQLHKYEDYGYVISPNYTVLPYADNTYAATFLQQFYQESINAQGSNPNYVLIRFDIGAVAKYEGHFVTNDGFLDDDMYIQDSYRYQKYSYLITVDEKLESYKSLMKSYLHPAGTALFGEYQIQNDFNVQATAMQELGQWRSFASFNQINKSITPSYAIITGEGGRIRIEPYDTDVYMAPEELYNPPESYVFTG
jgi:hypothetical protein